MRQFFLECIRRRFFPYLKVSKIGVSSYGFSTFDCNVIMLRFYFSGAFSFLELGCWSAWLVFVASWKIWTNGNGLACHRPYCFWELLGTLWIYDQAGAIFYLFVCFFTASEKLWMQVSSQRWKNVIFLDLQTSPFPDRTTDVETL